MKVSKNTKNKKFEEFTIELKFESLDDLEIAHPVFESIGSQTFMYAEQIFNLLDEELNKYK